MDDYNSEKPPENLIKNQVDPEKQAYNDDDLKSEWDGSEAEFVADDDAAEYEEQYSGIKLKYKLTKEEIKTCYKRAGFYKLSINRSVALTVLASIVGLFFGFMFCVTKDYDDLVILMLCLAFILVIWSIPILLREKIAAKSLKSGYTYVEIYPDELIINKNNTQWTIPLDSSCEFEEYDDLMIIFTKDSKVFGIPIRCIEPSVMADVQAMLEAGTVPRNNED